MGTGLGLSRGDFFGSPGGGVAKVHFLELQGGDTKSQPGGGQGGVKTRAIFLHKIPWSFKICQNFAIFNASKTAFTI